MVRVSIEVCLIQLCGREQELFIRQMYESRPCVPWNYEVGIRRASELVCLHQYIARVF